MSTTQPFTILQLSDPHILPSPEDTLMGVNTEYYWQSVFNLAMQNHPDAGLIIVSGDLAQKPCPTSYRRILKTLSTTSIPSICLPGNHDDYGLMQQILNLKTINCNKQFVHENWQIISLNSQIKGETGGYLSENELHFLETCLNRYPDLHALITFHHHCIPTGSQWMDTMQITNSDLLFQILADYPQVHAITNGHIHQNLESELNGIPVYSAPSTCFQFKPNSQEFALEKTAPGYRWFTLFSNGKITTNVERLGTDLLELDIYSSGY